MAQVTTISPGLQTGTEKSRTSGDNSNPRVSIAHYTAAEVIQQFLCLYNCLDFRSELEDIGITRYQFLRRKKALREFRALCISLWGLALQKSFPDDAASFFTEFNTTAPDLATGNKKSKQLHERINVYIELLVPKKDTDFSPVASYLAEVLALDDRDKARLRLKLSLIIRNLYMLIFNKLV